MRYYLDKSKPAYIQLYIRLRQDITQGIYKFGDRLPSKRTIAAETGTSVITAEHAYAILCDEGYCEARERSGYFVIYKGSDFFPVEEIPAEYEEKLPEPQNPEVFSFDVFSKTARVVLSRYSETLFLKSPGTGCDKLKKALCSYLARSRGIVVAPQQVVIGSGAEYLYGLIVQMLGEKKYALEKPSYSKIEKVYRANGVDCDFLKMGSDGVLSAELARTSAKVLHVTPFNSYPSGITASASKRNEYISWARDTGGIIIEDDFSSEFSVSTKTQDTLFSLEAENSVLYINTFSKTIAPSVRVGYMVLPKNRTEELLEKIKFYSCTVSLFEQYIIAELINNGSFERHINRIRRKRRKN